ncbi:MAG TPA: hypothetical protein V6D09_17050, partial [Leptolyngbyaceae cyanobacterium]
MYLPLSQQDHQKEEVAVLVKKLETHDKDWALAFKAIQHPFISANSANNEYLNFHAGLTEVHWIFGLHYAFKRKWDSKHKIPIKLRPTVQKSFRLWGDYLYTILELCIQCHASPGIQVSYRNASEWFERVAWEMKTSDLKAALSATKGLKRREVDQQRELLKVLKEYENPGNLQTHPHAFALVESARNLAQRSDVFCNRHWKPFITAGTNLLRDMERNSTWQTVFEKDGLPYVQAGRGNRILP